MSGTRHAGDDEERRQFERAMQGVEPLPGASRRIPAARRPLRDRARPAVGRRAVRIEVERLGERVEGRASGVDRRRLTALARGDVPVDAELDLHGLSAEVARDTLLAALARAEREERRCLLVIHGRGRSSDGLPVLKEAVPGWLTRPPAAARVLAFASAPPHLGGAGALLVLLRRRKRGGRGA